MDYLDYAHEREDALAQDAMTSGEYTRMAVNQYTAAYGHDAPEEPWILSPFDTWEANPFYHGPPVPHPEYEGE